MPATTEDYVANTDLKAGDIVLISGSISRPVPQQAAIPLVFGQVVGDIKAGATGTVQRGGIVTVPKITTDVFAIGSKAYYISTVQIVSLQPADGILGTVVGGGAEGDNTVDIDLDQQ